MAEVRVWGGGEDDGEGRGGGEEEEEKVLNIIYLEDIICMYETRKWDYYSI